ncbi:MAG TPA: chorismate mutase [Candidatus Gastranaerophilales bacterium]|nr:chorismate mutase [Candidatus Gastranaerophilales bacterium]
MQKKCVVRAVRGAVTVEENAACNINKATLELLDTLVKLNEIDEEDIVSVIFTLTQDLNAEFPAKSARTNLGWDSVPMICASEIPVPGSIEKCIRVMITFNTIKNKNEIRHVYLGEAQRLRPDLV